MEALEAIYIIMYYHCRDACAINIGAKVVLTGGYYSMDRVSEYTVAGFLRDLPELLRGRKWHGCSYFNNIEGLKVIFQ